MQGAVRVIYKKSIFQKTHLPVLSINFFKLSLFDTCGTPIFLNPWTQKKKKKTDGHIFGCKYKDL